MPKKSMTKLGAAVLVLFAATTVGTSAAAAHSGDDANGRGGDRTVTLSATLTELNDSGASGTATAVVRNQTIEHIEVRAEGLSPDAPHAQHIHYGDQAMNECPTLALDENGDGLISTLEGVPAYGPVVVSLTTSGDTSPASVLAVDRYPVSEGGVLTYSRDDIDFSRVAGTGYAGGGGTPKQIADAIRDGEGVIVIHGLDYDGDGQYSFGTVGVSDLNSALPAEATDPAACGVLRVQD